MLEVARLSRLPPAAELWAKTVRTFLMDVGEVLLTSSIVEAMKGFLWSSKRLPESGICVLTPERGWICNGTGLARRSHHFLGEEVASACERQTSGSISCEGICHHRTTECQGREPEEEEGF